MYWNVFYTFIFLERKTSFTSKIFYSLDPPVHYLHLHENTYTFLEHFKVPILCILPNQKADSECFCQLTGYLDDCSCEIEVLDSYNNKVIYPQLHQLLQRNYFRYYKE